MSLQRAGLMIFCFGGGIRREPLINDNVTRMCEFSASDQIPMNGDRVSYQIPLRSMPCNK